MLKLNSKGYMLVEIIVASVLTITIGYYLLNLTYEFKNTLEDIYQSYYYTKDKVLVTKNVMSDLERGTAQNIEEDTTNHSYITFDLYFSEKSFEKRKILLTKSNDDKTILEYGKIDNNNEFVTDDVSYYKKEFEPTLIIGGLEYVYDKDYDSLVISVPAQSIYDDNDYTIKLFVEYFEANMISKLFTDVNKAEKNHILFKSDTYREKIKEVFFVDHTPYTSGEYASKYNVLFSWNISKNEDVNNIEDASVMAWIVDNDTDGYYDLYIGSKNQDEIYAESLYGFFSDMTGLENISFNNLDTSLTGDMSSMFRKCTNLKELDLRSFDTSRVTNMNSMFSGLGKNGQKFPMNIEKIELANWDTSKVTNMENLFANCINLKSLDLTNWDTSSVKDMHGMFIWCSSLTSLDVSNFNTSNVTVLSQMFHGCSSLTEISFGENFVINKNVKSMYEMFYGCSSLTDLNLSNWDTSFVTSMESMFSGCSSLTSLNLSTFKTGSVTNMKSMFAGCSGLIDLNVSSFDTGKVTDMASMFAGCSKLTSLNVSSFNTIMVGTDEEKKGSMANMFDGCSGLTVLNVDNFVTSSVPSMYRMFAGCSKLENIIMDSSKFITAGVSDMAEMFAHCSSLTSLNLNHFETNQVTNMSRMFTGCTNLKELIISNFNTSKVENFNYMFSGCNNLNTSLTIKSEEDNPTYEGIFDNVSTEEGAQLIINYTTETEDLVDAMIVSKSANSNVIKGKSV